VLLFTDTDAATLYLCPAVSICRFGSCYLHQSRFRFHNLCYIGNIAFVVSPGTLKIGYSIFLVAAIALLVVDYYVLDNHGVR
jgi:hypothetical protein